MWRYIGTAAFAALLLALALKSRQSRPEDRPDPDVRVVQVQPQVEVVEVPGGLDLTVTHLFAGAVSRASLVYDYDGERRTIDETTNCRKSLATASAVESDTYRSEVQLGGRVPEGTTEVHILLEDETGTRIVPVALD